MKDTKIFKMSFSSVYPFYIQKANKNGRTKDEVDEIICWLTGYDINSLQRRLDQEVDFESFFNNAPQINPNTSFIKGVICGYHVEDIENDLMRNIRYPDKLIDELAKGKSMDKILRKK